MTKEKRDMPAGLGETAMKAAVTISDVSFAEIADARSCPKAQRARDAIIAAFVASGFRVRDIAHQVRADCLSITLSKRRWKSPRSPVQDAVYVQVRQIVKDATARKRLPPPPRPAAAKRCSFPLSLVPPRRSCGKTTAGGRYCQSHLGLMKLQDR